MEIIKEEKFFRYCGRCGKDISEKRLDAKFCSRNCKCLFGKKLKTILRKQLKKQKGVSGI